MNKKNNQEVWILDSLGLSADTTATTAIKAKMSGFILEIRIWNFYPFEYQHNSNGL